MSIAVFYSPYNLALAGSLYTWFVSQWCVCIFQHYLMMVWAYGILCRYLIRRQLKLRYMSMFDVADLFLHIPDYYFASDPIQNFNRRQWSVSNLLGNSNVSLSFLLMVPLSPTWLLRWLLVYFISLLYSTLQGYVSTALYICTSSRFLL